MAVKSMSQGSFSRQINNFVFIFYPKAWTMPNLAIRHAHGGMNRNTYALDENRRCTYVDWRNEKGQLVYSKLRDGANGRHCPAVCPDELITQAVRECLYEFGSNRVVSPSRWFKETVAFKSKALRQLSTEWYTRAYKNKYTKDETRWVFYHDCLGKAKENTFYKGMFDHLLPYLEKPWACQVCGTEIPKGVRMAVRLQKAGISL